MAVPQLHGQCEDTGSCGSRRVIFAWLGDVQPLEGQQEVPGVAVPSGEPQMSPPAPAALGLGAEGLVFSPEGSV